MTNAELNEEIKRFVAEYGYERSEDILLIAIVARQFYDLGCCRAAEKYDEIEYNRQRAEESVPNDLEEAAYNFANQDCARFTPRKNGFIAGAKWQKEQMMKDAIHYVVQDDLDSHGASYNIPFIRLGTVALKPKGIGVGDKVCIIIVKEDEK